MALDYKTPEQCAEQYLQHLKSLKPEVNTEQTDSDWWIRSQVVGGMVAGIYADQVRISNDPFPQSARREGLEKSLNTYFGGGFRSATPSVGQALLTAATGSVIVAGTQLEYQPNGNLYAVTEDFDFGTSATGVVSIQSLATGQNQNLLQGAPLVLPSPPAGVQPTATVFGAPLSDGRNIESNEEAAARLLTQIRSPLAGGKVTDYQQFALNADPAVTSATVSRYPFGLGTVGIVITAGTTDIDAALDNGEPIILIPSDDLVSRVQDYIETQNPVTDCAYVLKPATVPIDVTISVRYSQGDGSTILSGQTLTQAELVQREVQRAILKTPPGGRKFTGNATGYVVAAEIEEVVDLNLSASPYTVGEKAQIITDRQVADLTVSGANRSLLGDQVAFPGTINVVTM